MKVYVVTKTVAAYEMSFVEIVTTSEAKAKEFVDRNNADSEDVYDYDERELE